MSLQVWRRKAMYRVARLLCASREDRIREDVIGALLAPGAQ